MSIIFAIWLLTVCIGYATWALTLFRVHKNLHEATALRLSALATLPSLLPLGEYVVIRLSDATGSRYLVPWLFLIGSLFGLVLLIGSFLDVPWHEPKQELRLVRLVHVVAWATGSIMSVAMVLDV